MHLLYQDMQYEAKRDKNPGVEIRLQSTLYSQLRAGSADGAKYPQVHLKNYAERSRI